YSTYERRLASRTGCGTCPPLRSPPPLDCPPHPLGDLVPSRRDDHQRPTDLRGLRPLWEPRRPVLPESLRRHPLPPVEPAWRLARRPSGRALLAVLDRLDLRRLHDHPRGPPVGRRSCVVPGDAPLPLSGEIPES